jgi:phosphoribosylaminoimidazolecarboxamide formyltransferase / IMP cyclohydrolase
VANAIDNYVGATADKGWVSSIDGPAPGDLTAEERKQWAASLTGVALGSDAFFPFADNIQRAKLVI